MDGGLVLFLKGAWRSQYNVYDRGVFGVNHGGLWSSAIKGLNRSTTESPEVRV